MKAWSRRLKVLISFLICCQVTLALYRALFDQMSRELGSDDYFRRLRGLHSLGRNIGFSTKTARYSELERAIREGSVAHSPCVVGNFTFPSGALPRYS